MAVTSTRIAAGGADTMKADLRLMVLSVVLWAVGVLMIRFMIPYGPFGVRIGFVLFAATLPVVWLTIDLVRRIAGPAMALLPAVTLASFPALILDGVAMTFLPRLYAPEGVDLRPEAAWLLWFVGTSLALAHWRQLRQNRQPA